MKTRNLKDEKVLAQGGGCCAPTTSETKKESNDLCCEQPVDGSSCCDRSAPKEVNSEKTGCC